MGTSKDGVDGLLDAMDSKEPERTCVDGLWIWSQDEERWSCAKGYATREEALAAGRAETDSEDGPLWTGKAKRFRGEHAARFLVEDFDTADENLQEDGEWCAEDELIHSPTKDQEDELHRLIADWMDRNGLCARWYSIEDMEQAPEVPKP